MTDRIDHAAEARQLLKDGLEPGAHFHPAVQYARAQVHATLALVEQQRIANLVALTAIEFDLDDGAKGRIVKGLVDITRDESGLLNFAVDPDIATALGIEEA